MPEQTDDRKAEAETVTNWPLIRKLLGSRLTKAFTPRIALSLALVAFQEV